MDFELPGDLVDFLARLDKFVEEKIRPIENRDDNIRFFDHRREWARTDFEGGGLPRADMNFFYPAQVGSPPPQVGSERGHGPGVVAMARGKESV